MQKISVVICVGVMFSYCTVQSCNRSGGRVPIRPVRERFMTPARSMSDREVESILEKRHQTVGDQHEQRWSMYHINLQRHLMKVLASRGRQRFSQETDREWERCWQERQRLVKQELEKDQRANTKEASTYKDPLNLE